MEDNFTGLNGYEREKNVDTGFGVFKGKVNCKVNYARIEANDGSFNEELTGVDFFKYELEVVGHDTLSKRKIWGSFNLENEDKQRKLANIFFTVGLNFNNKEELLIAAEEFVKMIVNVSAWGWAPNEEDIDEDTGKPRRIQLHKILGIVDAAAAIGEAPESTEF